MGWLMVFFDLPVDSKEARKAAADFRNDLLRNGYIRLQYSVYARPCPTLERLKTHSRRIQSFVPEQGEVRTIVITDEQWKRMTVYYKKKKNKPENMPEQLLFF